MPPSRFRRSLVFGVNQFAVLEYLLLHHGAVVGISGQRAVAWRGAELHQLVAAEDVGVRAFLAVVAVKVLDDIFVVAFADQLAMEAAFDCAVAHIRHVDFLAFKFCFDDGFQRGNILGEAKFFCRLQQ